MLFRSNEIHWYAPGFGTVIFPKLRRGSVDDISAHLREHYDTSIAPGSFFEMPDHFRIGLGVQPEIFQEGLRRLGCALDDAAQLKD